jgi:hypothetical protein
MPTPSSGPISFQNLNNTFGTGTPVSFATLYRNGPYVPNISPDNSVPLSGPISLEDFYSTWGRKSLAFTITVGNGNAGKGKGKKGLCYGYRQSGFGSISSASFLTPDGTMQIKSFYYSVGLGSWILQLSSTSSPADTDISFRSISVSGYSVGGVRASRTSTSALSNYRTWRWNVGGGSHPTSGTISCTINYYG